MDMTTNDNKQQFLNTGQFWGQYALQNGLK